MRDPIALTIAVKYSCPLCGIIKQVVQVPARESESVDVKRWMDQTIGLVAQDHLRRSPLCSPKELHDLMIPIEGAAFIGGVPVQ